LGQPPLCLENIPNFQFFLFRAKKYNRVRSKNTQVKDGSASFFAAGQKYASVRSGPISTGYQLNEGCLYWYTMKLLSQGIDCQISIEVSPGLIMLPKIFALLLAIMINVGQTIGELK